MNEIAFREISKIFDQNTSDLEKERIELDQQRVQCLDRLSVKLSLDEIVACEAELTTLSQRESEINIKYQKRSYDNNQQLTDFLGIDTTKANEILSALSKKFQMHYQQCLEEARLEEQKQILLTYVLKLQLIQRQEKERVWPLGTLKEHLAKNNMVEEDLKQYLGKNNRILTECEKEAVEYFYDVITWKLIHYGVRIKNSPGINEKQLFEISTLVKMIQQTTNASSEDFNNAVQGLFIQASSCTDSATSDTEINTERLQENIQNETISANNSFSRTVFTISNIEPIDARDAQIFYEIVRKIKADTALSEQKDNATAVPTCRMQP